MVKITVPATSANIGGGFDCLGIAVNVFNEIYVRINDCLKIETDMDLPADERNLVYRSIVKTFERAVEMGLGRGNELMESFLSDKSKPLPLYIKQINRIPKTSGMGSSAACIVGGVLAANSLLGDIFNKNEIAALCAKAEGHPDNVLPALLGGVVAGCMLDNGGVTYIKENISKEIKINLYTPSFSLETKRSRQVLPQSYNLKDVVYSLSRAVVTFGALANGDVKVLKNAVGDRLHEKYRSVLIADFDNVVKMNDECGAIATYLSGAGPTVAAFVNDKFKSNQMKERLSYLPNNWKMLECEISRNGAKVENI